jgi:23S rRNA pseudouridine1911/1915/1917 synthase
LANALVARHPECATASADPREGGLAHRLDIDTSGAIVAARTPEAYRALRSAFSGGAVEKEYWALCVGQPPPVGQIDAPLTRTHGGTQMRTASVGRVACTTFEVLGRGDGCALVRATARTGRMHQIRAHLASIGHPLVGDTRYGGPDEWAGVRLAGHLLHAARLRLPHPLSGAPLEIECPLPPDRRGLYEAAVGAAAIPGPARPAQPQ